MSQPIDISSLPVEQLANIIKQMEEEIQYLQESYSQLKMAKDKWGDSTDALKSFVPENKDKEIFVPLSSSLYVKGKMTNVETVLVDIGTGYFCEKSIGEATAYTNRKIQDIDSKLTKINQAIDQKQNYLIQIQMVFQAKLATQQQKFMTKK